MKVPLALLLVAAVGFAWWRTAHPTPTVLALRLDQHFDEVVENSTYPVLNKGNSRAPKKEFDGSADILVTKPAVIIKYDDPKNGFTLPPTTFAGVGFTQYRVGTVRTTPMLEALPFDEALRVLETVQNQFKNAGWQPWPDDNSQWFDLSPEGRRKLHADLFRYFGRGATIIVPKRNLEIHYDISCTDECDSVDRARFLVNVGIGKKSYYSYDGE
ncbi:MAG: hypothetical protein ABWY02_11845 [Telluria sp.]